MLIQRWNSYLLTILHANPSKDTGERAIFDRLPKVQPHWAPTTELAGDGIFSSAFGQFHPTGQSKHCPNQHFQMENQPETTTHIQKVS
jgi:hypothetical protein